MRNYRLLRKGLYSDYEGSYKFKWRDVIRWAIHLPIGAVIAYFILEVDSTLGVMTGIFFLAYEIMEDIVVRDWSFKDVFGSLLAMIATGFIIKIWF